MSHGQPPPQPRRMDVGGYFRQRRAVEMLREVAPDTAAIAERWSRLWRPSDASEVFHVEHDSEVSR